MMQYLKWSLLFFVVLPLAIPSFAAKKVKPVSTICVNAETGEVIFEEHADIQRPPASMIKLMMMLMVAEGVEAQRWTLETPIEASKHAQKMGGTQVYLEAGEVFPLEKMMGAVAVASANDAAMAVAEQLWGSEAGYLQAMNDRARLLEMKNSVFHSVHGLPPDKGEDYDQTTARDMALLGCECTRHPLVMQWVKMKQYQFRPDKAVHHNTNKLLWRMEDCDGMKTGFIRAAGFCITATAERNGIRLISVVMGSQNKYGRFNLAQKLLEDGFAAAGLKQVVKKGTPVGAPVAVTNCEYSKVRLSAAEDITILSNALKTDEYQIELRCDQPLKAPLKAGEVVGEIVVLAQGKIVGRGGAVLPINLMALCESLQTQ